MSSKETTITDNSEQTVADVDRLRDKAKKLGIEFHHNTGIDKLVDMINEKLGAADTSTNEGLSKAELKMQSDMFKREQAALNIRVMITCNDPSKADIPGETFGVGNKLIGTITKYIPYHSAVPYHIPKALLTTLEDKEYQHFYKVRDPKTGKPVTKTRLAKTFSIQLLPAITLAEADAIRTRQKAIVTMDDL